MLICLSCSTVIQLHFGASFELIICYFNATLLKNIELSRHIIYLV